MSPANTDDVRQRILDATEAIVTARGVPALTIEAAARDAGVSKGGLLYHFASKEALLQALLNRLAAFIEAEMDAMVAAQTPGPHRAARAVLAWSFEVGPCVTAAERYDRAAAVFLATHHHDPALLDPLRAVFQGMKQRMLDEGTPAGAALAIMAAGDGLFMAHVFRTWSVTDAEREAIHATLAGLLEHWL